MAMVEGHGTLIATRFALRIVNGDAGYPPPEEKRSLLVIPQTGARCAVCGGGFPSGETAWRRSGVLAVSFADRVDLNADGSDLVCQACAYFAVGETWQAYHRRARLTVKTWAAASWRSYSHIFCADGHIVPRREDWRRLLINPPEPPFLAIMSTQGRQNIIFRATVATDRDVYPIQVDVRSLFVVRTAIGRMLADIEEALAAGFSKTSIETGNYNQASVLKAGISVWGRIENRLRRHRLIAPEQFAIAVFAAASPSGAEDAFSTTAEESKAA